MPALPEVEVVRRDLEREVVGRRIKDVDVRPGSNAMKIIKRHGRRKEFQELLAGARVDSVGRIGRWIAMELDNERWLLVHLGDAGLLLKTSASDGLASHTHIVIGFTIGGQLRVVDRTLGGEVYAADKDGLAQIEAECGDALDPLESPLAWQRFSALLERQAVSMKELLSSEAFIAGLGDIYSDEVLFEAGLRHDRSSDHLSSQDVRRLYRALMETLQDAVKARGTTCRAQEFRDLQGNPGLYQQELKVFNREGESCRRCRSAIVKERLDNGETFFCPRCQS
jgi:formamidopyrimidine-DNA glycosylase